ncbi:regulator of MON1-CCZ1 complex [Dendrobium catenatum]|uniref:Uncharacterized protein n=1 Tax=Dendrobium catenatum TaxID=906689 RepID=A0A2I0WQQ6_9ASPA|nr:regulator of MON1-CCZ1 complex [Dendrobium catenatum]XP_020675723.1 regulator of MON1-CCZ1 complex [Dendrobium catenatum]XP_028551424.1 regulator of MON1-CCZ1 complex [Dendrobium catenatum]PKU77994.1 hypothetical protein MA16_Dca011614 [Dendrobium catenatum]
MFGSSSRDPSSAVLCGSGALSHVYIQHPPLRCNIPETHGLFYDDGNKLLLSPTSDQVLSWKTAQCDQYDPPNSDSISEGPVLSIRYSLDKKVICIQRSNQEIQFKNKETGKSFSWRCKSGSESILGFFWTDCPSCDIIFIKTSGIESLLYDAELNTLRLVEAKRFNVSWYVYTHESRMVLLASGMQCTTFYGFQFSSGGIIRLPKFEMTMVRTEANQKPVLAVEDVHIATIYGRIYCLQHDRAGMILNLYRFYRDAVVHQGTLPTYSNRIAVSVVDNVLLVHQVDSKVVIIYDLFLDSLAPVSAPLPLLLRGASVNGKQAAQVGDNIAMSYGAMIYADKWSFLVPDLICDLDHGLLWKIYLDLEAIAASSSDIPYLLEFLQRRKSDTSKSKLLCLAIMRSIILERRPVSIISSAIDVLVAAYSHVVKAGSALHGGDRRASETFPDSSTQQTENPGSLFVDSVGGTKNNENFVKQESSSRAESKSQQPACTNVKNEHFNDAAVSAAPGVPACSVSSSDADTDLESRNHSTQHPEMSLSGDSSAKETRTLMQPGRGAETPVVKGEESSIHAEAFENRISSIESGISSNQGAQLSTAAISPDEMYNFVFAIVEDEMGGDPAYLVAIIVEFLRSVFKEKMKVHPKLYVMTIQLLVRSNRYAEVGLLVINKVLEPSKEVALQLLDSGRQNLQLRKLGMDMLRQLSLHHDYVNLLLQYGYYLEALRYARRNKVITVSPSLFLEAALATNDSQQLAAVVRFFSDFTPGFKSTAEHSRFLGILTEMS